MRFDPVELEAIQRFLKEKWSPPRTCAVCRTNPESWRVSETPVLLALLTGERNISLSDFRKAIKSIAVAPTVALTCSHCGHILLFSATEMNLGTAEHSRGPRFSIPSEEEGSPDTDGQFPDTSR